VEIFRVSTGPYQVPNILLKKTELSISGSRAVTNLLLSLETCKMLKTV